jgi:molybdopterin-synthase adenylyltransferase
MVEFTEKQLQRYSRNILVKEISVAGQKRISSSRILIIGAGGLGSCAAIYCAAAGIGMLGIADYDKVEISNLQRQILHDTNDIGINKADSAKAKINSINPDVTVQTYRMRLNKDNIRDVVRQYDFVIECTDNFQSKFLVNDACFFENIPFSHGGILQMSGQTITVIPGITTCVRCIFNAPPCNGSVPACSEAGVLGSVAGIIGSIQATEALKYVAKAGHLLTDRILTLDAGTMNFRTVVVPRQADCPVCGKNPSVTSL